MIQHWMMERAGNVGLLFLASAQRFTGSGSSALRAQSPCLYDETLLFFFWLCDFCVCVMV